MFFPCWTRTRGPVSTPGPFTRCSWNWPRLLDRAPTQVMDGHRALHADHMNLRYTEYLDFAADLPVSGISVSSRATSRCGT